MSYTFDEDISIRTDIAFKDDENDVFIAQETAMNLLQAEGTKVH